MNWTDLPFFTSPEFERICDFLEEQKNEGVLVHPAPQDVLAAFELTPLESVRVVILGQDPYPTPGHAHGLAFSVQPGVKMPPSLRNINTEIQDEYAQCPGLSDGFLEHWATQGVLLLNTALTVETGNPGSHKVIWAEFTNAVIKTLNNEREGLIFLLWGRQAQQKSIYIDKQRHMVLEAAHPSPLAAVKGFFGCGHFRKVNDELAARGQRRICWCHSETCMVEA